MRIVSRLALIVVGVMSMGAVEGGQDTVALRGRVVDAQSGELLAARVYIRSADGRWFFAKSASPDGSAVEYRKQRFETSVEMHTTLSPHPFIARVPRGRYTVRAERGKEWTPAEAAADVGDEPAEVTLRLRRWAHMAAGGWYSGDTHVHRSLEELPNVMLAEDLNVALPLSYWVTSAYQAPRKSAVKPDPIRVDATHVIYPVNTEYELFRVGPKRHTLGAVIILGHRTPFTQGAPPVAPIAERARTEGALLDLDKHSWPWSLMLVPVMKVDLFELANNHCWRTEFGFRRWTIDAVPASWGLERDERGLTEWGWIDFGLKTYYALLNCGFRMRPTAGTASGVHPVPLGFGRVYVHVDGEFSYAKWMHGLSAGRSFVTTGPLLLAEVDDLAPGSTLVARGPKTCRISGVAHSIRPLRAIEVVVNGDVVKRLDPSNKATEAGSHTSAFGTDIALDGSSWIAVRAFEKRPGGRVRFAHSSPVHVEIPGRPLRPRRREIDCFVQRMQEELKRNEGVLRPNELDEYRQALAIYQRIAAQAR